MSIPVFYVPRLLPASVSGAVPAGVLFFPCGPASGKNSAPPDPEDESAIALTAVRSALPLQAREAAAVLAEMQSTGETWAGNGMLRQMTARQALEREGSGRDVRPGEMADLERFTHAGEAPPAAREAQERAPLETEKRARNAEAERRALVDCQKILLLAEAQEKGMLEVRNLEARCLRAEQALQEALGEDDEWEAPGEDDGREAPLAGAARDLPERSGPPSSAAPWRVVLEAVLPFLPEEALFFTSDADMADDLREAGMLRPVSPERAKTFAHWPPELIAGLLVARAPAWRLIGRRHLSEERPWLRREVEVLVASLSEAQTVGNGTGETDVRADGKDADRRDWRNTRADGGGKGC